MSKKLGVFIMILAGTLLIWGLYSMVRLIVIQYKGSPIIATVLYVENECDKYNEIRVIIENKTYPVTISRTDCRNRVYKVGQSITLLKYKDDKILVWPEAEYQLLPFILIAASALGYYTNKDKFRKAKKPTPNNALAKYGAGQ